MKTCRRANSPFKPSVNSQVRVRLQEVGGNSNRYCCDCHLVRLLCNKAISCNSVKFRMEPISFSSISEWNMLQASARFTPDSALEQ